MPRIAVLVGGPHKAQALDDDYLESLKQCLVSLHAWHGGSFLVSTSRRTPPEMRAALRSWFTQWPGVFWADRSDGENSYPGMLAWADRFVVSSDSVNMISEDRATGKPVHAFAPKPVAGKLACFHDALRDAGYLCARWMRMRQPRSNPCANCQELPSACVLCGAHTGPPCAKPSRSASAPRTCVVDVFSSSY